MKQPLINLVFVLAFLFSSTLVHGSSPVEGRWHTPDAEGTVEIEVVDGLLTGELVASTDKRAKIGTKILRDFVRNGDSWKGKIYAPKHDRVLDANLSFGDGKLVLRVSAGLRSKSMIWTRAD